MTTNNQKPKWLIIGLIIFASWLSIRLLTTIIPTKKGNNKKITDFIATNKSNRIDTIALVQVDTLKELILNNMVNYHLAMQIDNSPYSTYVLENNTNIASATQQNEIELLFKNYSKEVFSIRFYLKKDLFSQNATVSDANELIQFISIFNASASTYFSNVLKEIIQNKKYIDSEPYNDSKNHLKYSISRSLIHGENYTTNKDLYMVFEINKL